MKEGEGVKEGGGYKGRTSYTTMWLALCRGLEEGGREGGGGREEEERRSRKQE